jgi:hypothetical protein
MPKTLLSLALQSKYIPSSPQDMMSPQPFHGVTRCQALEVSCETAGSLDGGYEYRLLSSRCDAVQPGRSLPAAGQAQSNMPLQATRNSTAQLS